MSNYTIITDADGHGVDIVLKNGERASSILQSPEGVAIIPLYDLKNKVLQCYSKSSDVSIIVFTSTGDVLRDNDNGSVILCHDVYTTSKGWMIIHAIVNGQPDVYWYNHVSGDGKTLFPYWYKKEVEPISENGNKRYYCVMRKGRNSHNIVCNDGVPILKKWYRRVGVYDPIKSKFFKGYNEKSFDIISSSDGKVLWSDVDRVETLNPFDSEKFILYAPFFKKIKMFAICNNRFEDLFDGMRFKKIDRNTFFNEILTVTNDNGECNVLTVDDKGKAVLMLDDWGTEYTDGITGIDPNRTSGINPNRVYGSNIFCIVSNFLTIKTKDGKGVYYIYKDSNNVPRFVGDSPEPLREEVFVIRGDAKHGHFLFKKMNGNIVLYYYGYSNNKWIIDRRTTKNSEYDNAWIDKTLNVVKLSDDGRMVFGIPYDCFISWVEEEDIVDIVYYDKFAIFKDKNDKYIFYNPNMSIDKFSQKFDDISYIDGCMFNVSNDSVEGILNVSTMEIKQI